jgi:hypothetical protein
MGFYLKDLKILTMFAFFFKMSLINKTISLFEDVSSFSVILLTQDRLAFPISISYRYFICIKTFNGFKTLWFLNKSNNVFYLYLRLKK